MPLQVKEQEIKDLYIRWRGAIIANDIQFLQQLFSDDFQSVRNVGRPKGKVDELLWMGVRNVQYLNWEDTNVSIDTAGEIAVVRCTQRLQVLIYDLPARIDREILLTFVRQDNQWLLQQFSEVPACSAKTRQ